ncbi:YceI family protein [Chitinophaga horti]|uniref:YceI family protein n=1 Tax=Chitinophaga horti TaxID=2920382 RepID=A0ABY6IUK9_9BACT|nr:YceI family protein [Chitinophaga horti]UYQ91058.1 YceI family protein [Chitinophaga horti]
MKSLVKMMLFLAFAAVSCKKSAEHTATKPTTWADSSRIEWTGFEDDIAHKGFFDLKDGKIRIEDGRVTGGTFNIDIASMASVDAASEEMRRMMLDKLLGPDFFNIALHPSAKFEILEVTPYAGNKFVGVDGANALVHGELTMMGNSMVISFPAKIELNDRRILVDASFTLDRTDWGMNSATNPGDELYVEKAVDIRVKINAGRS